MIEVASKFVRLLVLNDLFVIWHHDCLVHDTSVLYGTRYHLRRGLQRGWNFGPLYLDPLMSWLTSSPSCSLSFCRCSLLSLFSSIFCCFSFCHATSRLTYRCVTKRGRRPRTGQPKSTITQMAYLVARSATGDLFKRCWRGSGEPAGNSSSLLSHLRRV